MGAAARLFPVEPGRLVPTLTGEELAVDKVLAVFGRAEARDFVDLLALEPRYGLDRLGALATEKDRGFTPAVFADMLGRFSRLRQEEFGIDALLLIAAFCAAYDSCLHDPGPPGAC